MGYLKVRRQTRTLIRINQALVSETEVLEPTSLKAMLPVSGFYFKLIQNIKIG